MQITQNLNISHEAGEQLINQLKALNDIKKIMADIKP